MANREFNLDKFTTPEISALQTAEELREQLEATQGAEIRTQLAQIFDESTFVEIGAYVKRSFSDYVKTEKMDELEGVICGYGAIDGKLAFVFAEDAARLGGAIDDRHAKKITDLYQLAVKNGAPVIGIFNSTGADIFCGASSLAAYGKIIKAVNDASGVIPQIAYVAGKCLGTAATIAAMFDFVIKADGADFYVTAPSLTGAENAQADKISYVGDGAQCAGFIRSLVAFLPENAAVGADVGECADNLNRMVGDLDFGGDALSMIATIADNGVYYEIGKDTAPALSTVFTTFGGVKCGVVATSFAKNEGRLTAAAAKKAADFVSFCDLFSIPVVTLVDSLGLATDAENEKAFADALARLAVAYASSENAKVTVIAGHAIGASFVLLGSKALGADIVYATDDSEIGALAADSGVAFAWNRYVTEETKRETLAEAWKASVASPVAAAATGEIDDIISVNELRARICSSLLMLSAKGKHLAL